MTAEVLRLRKGDVVVITVKHALTGQQVKNAIHAANGLFKPATCVVFDSTMEITTIFTRRKLGRRDYLVLDDEQMAKLTANKL